MVTRSIGILVVLVFSKVFYLSSLSSYYTFYLIQTFQISVQDSQVYLFVFLGAVAAGTFVGGPLGVLQAASLIGILRDSRLLDAHALDFLFEFAILGAHSTQVKVVVPDVAGRGLRPDERFRAPHILCLRFPGNVLDAVIAALAREQVYVAARLGRMRISPHVYNDDADADRFVTTLTRAMA